MAWVTNTTSGDRRVPRVIVAFGAPVSVDAETVLMALTELGVLYSDISVTLRNHDGANRAALYVEQSEGGTVADDEREVVYVPAGKERTIEFRDTMRRMFGVTASGDPDAGLTAVNVSWQVVGRARIRMP